MKIFDYFILQDRRLMVMLSNCHHTYAVILPRLVDNLKKHGYPDMENVYQVR